MMESKEYTKGTEFAKKFFEDEHGEFKGLPLLVEDDDFPKELVTWVYGYLLQERPGISVRLKFLTAISMLTCLEREESLADWIRGALNYGITKEEIQEVIITMGVYAGWPATRTGLRVFQEVIGRNTKFRKKKEYKDSR